jgi:glutamine synthetase
MSDAASQDRRDDVERATEYLQEHDAAVVRLEVPDIDGVLRGKRLTPSRFLRGLQSGGFAWSQAIFCWDIAGRIYGNLRDEAWQNGFFGDIVVVPDLSTLAPVPGEVGAVGVLADARDARGREVPVAPRTVLRRVDRALHERELEIHAAVELEFVLLRETPETIRTKRFVGLEPADPGDMAYSLLRAADMLPMLDELQQECARADLEVEVVHTEPGPGMVEANLRHRPLLEAADQAIRFKQAAKQLARRRGLVATFMAKWANRYSGCGGHIHLSLWNRDGTSAFVDESGEWLPRFHHGLGGQLETMAELCVLFNPTTNSYHRVAKTAAAPRNASWAVQNRLAAIRVIPGPPGEARIEHRRSGADCNPYLALAGCTVGTIHGLDNEIVPWASVEGNAYDAPADVARPLPTTLREAAAAFRASDIARHHLGSEFVDHYADSREWEVIESEREVTDWEVKRYLEQI